MEEKTVKSMNLALERPTERLYVLIPTEMERLLNEKAKEMNIPVFLTGACKGFYYESKLKFDGLNIKALPPASPIAMYIKLWLLPKSEFDKAFLPCAEDF